MPKARLVEAEAKPVVRIVYATRTSKMRATLGKKLKHFAAAVKKYCRKMLGADAEKIAIMRPVTPPRGNTKHRSGHRSRDDDAGTGRRQRRRDDDRGNGRRRRRRDDDLGSNRRDFGDSKAVADLAAELSLMEKANSKATLAVEAAEADSEAKPAAGPSFIMKTEPLPASPSMPHAVPFAPQEKRKKGKDRAVPLAPQKKKKKTKATRKQETCANVD